MYLIVQIEVWVACLTSECKAPEAFYIFLCIPNKKAEILWSQAFEEIRKKIKRQVSSALVENTHKAYEMHYVTAAYKCLIYSHYTLKFFKNKVFIAFFQV